MKRIVVVLAAVGLMASYVVAEDLSDPPWDMTLPYTTTIQTWDFPDLLDGLTTGEEVSSPMPLLPHDFENPYGEPCIEWPSGQYEVKNPGGEWGIVTAVVTVDLVDYMPPWGEGPDDMMFDVPTVHIGVYDENGDGDTSRPVPVSIWIPNDPEERPVKMIFWQMTSDKSPTPQANPPTTNPPGTSVPTNIPHWQHDNTNWYTYNGMNEIRPNPDGEWLTFGLVHSTNIEEIVIKTICMPEPATLGLLAAGGLMMLVRRRRR